MHTLFGKQGSGGDIAYTLWPAGMGWRRVVGGNTAYHLLGHPHGDTAYTVKSSQVSHVETAYKI